MLSAVYPLLHQYTKLYEKLLSDLLVAHQTLCKLLSVLLQLFSTLSAKVRTVDMHIKFLVCHIDSPLWCSPDFATYSALST